MEYRHIRFFLILAEELHFTRAAARLNVAQPHLSQEIRRLEAELGVELFARTRRHVELTEAGRIFREKARRIIDVTEEARSFALRAGKGETGSLTIGFAGSAGYDVLPAAIRRFRSRWPEVKLVLKQMHTFDQLEALRTSQIDIGLMRRAAKKDRDLVSRTIRRERLVIALPSGHPLASEKAVAWKDLASQPWIVFDRTAYPGLFGDLQKACDKAGFEPVVAQEAGEIPTMINLVASGLGAALVPDSVTTLRRAGVVYRELRPTPSPSLLVMAWRSSSRSPTLRNFRDMIEAE